MRTFSKTPTLFVLIPGNCSVILEAQRTGQRKRNRWGVESSIPVARTCSSLSGVHFARPLRQINIHDSAGNYVRQLPTLRRWNIDGARPGRPNWDERYIHVRTRVLTELSTLSRRSPNARCPWSTDLHNESWIRLTTWLPSLSLITRVDFLPGTMPWDAWTVKWPTLDVDCLTVLSIFAIILFAILWKKLGYFLARQWIDFACKIFRS